MTVAARSQNPADETFDRELAALTPEARHGAWMARIEAVLFATSGHVQESDLQRVVGVDAAVPDLIADIVAALSARPYTIVRTGGGWLMRTRTDYAQAIRVAAQAETSGPDLNPREMAVLCAIAYHQPIDRAGLKDIFGKDINRELLARLRAHNLIASGPRAPRPGAPHTFVTTDLFLTTFDLLSLRDLPDLQL